jgi:hypothetical protein
MNILHVACRGADNRHADFVLQAREPRRPVIALGQVVVFQLGALLEEATLVVGELGAPLLPLVRRAAPVKWTARVAFSF